MIYRIHIICITIPNVVVLPIYTQFDRIHVLSYNVGEGRLPNNSSLLSYWNSHHWFKRHHSLLTWYWCLSVAHEVFTDLEHHNTNNHGHWSCRQAADDWHHGWSPEHWQWIVQYYLILNFMSSLAVTPYVHVCEKARYGPPACVAKQTAIPKSSLMIFRNLHALCMKLDPASQTSTSSDIWPDAHQRTTCYQVRVHRPQSAATLQILTEDACCTSQLSGPGTKLT